MKFTFLAVVAAVLLFVACDKKEETPAEACFDFAPQTDIFSGDEITLTNCSKDADSYLWDFGDGNTSLEESPVHTFDKGGEYKVSLVAYGHKNDTVIQVVTVNAIEATACFEIAPSNNVDPGDEISFTNCSQQSDSYLWDFGDGTTSALENPKHTYTLGGTYTITLIAKNEINDTVTQTISVNISNQFSVNGSTYDLSQGLIEYYGETSVGSFNHDIVLLSEGINVITQDGEIVGATGIGELVYFELFTADATNIADGQYVYSDTYAPGTFDYSHIMIGFNITTEDIDSYYEIAGGHINIASAGPITSVTMNLQTVDGYTVLGSFSGEMPRYDASFDKKGSKTKAFSKR